MLATSAVVGAVTSATVAVSLVDVVVTSEAAVSPVCADDALSSMAAVEDSRNVPLMASSIVVVTSDTAAPGTVDVEVSGIKGEGDRESVLLSADAGKSSAGAVTSNGRDGAPVASLASLASLAVTVVAALSGVVTASATAAASVASVTFVSIFATDTPTSGGTADVTSATSLMTTTFDAAPSLAGASVAGGAALVVVLSLGGVELVGTGGWSSRADRSESWSGAAVEVTEARQHDVS